MSYLRSALFSGSTCLTAAVIIRSNFAFQVLLEEVLWTTVLHSHIHSQFCHQVMNLRKLQHALSNSTFEVLKRGKWVKAILEAGADEEGDGEGGKDAAKATRRAAMLRDVNPSSTLEPSFESLNVKKFDIAFTVDPLFHKTSAQFDEGGARGEAAAQFKQKIHITNCHRKIEKDKIVRLQSDALEYNVLLPVVAHATYLAYLNLLRKSERSIFGSLLYLWPLYLTFCRPSAEQSQRFRWMRDLLCLPASPFPGMQQSCFPTSRCSGNPPCLLCPHHVGGMLG